ncbi:hypothetical protein HMPREF1148_1193 [Selenomonas sp. FOBRC6]|nr:hypothetical protein HMPREF1148_1193 [Selenomonas sp. FOBRC6]
MTIFLRRSWRPFHRKRSPSPVATGEAFRLRYLPCSVRRYPERTLVEQAEQSVRPAPDGFLPFKRSAFEIRRYLGGRAHDRLRN